MNHLRHSRVAIFAALTLLIAGGAVGAIAATSSGGRKAPARVSVARGTSATLVSDAQTRARPASRPQGAQARHVAMRRTFAAAAAYLGLSVQQLRKELREGKSLATIAQSTPGKSEEGLVSTIIKARQPREFAKVAKRIKKRVSAQIQRVGGLRVRRRIVSLRMESLSYLGISASQLRADQHSGESLAEIVKTIPGKSEAGLVEALVNARKQQLEAAVKAGLLKASASSTDVAALKKRITAYVQRTPHRLARARAAKTRSASS